jgi:hypothetical protein
MPRKARIDAPGALHHIIVRGIEKKAIFRDVVDRKDFLFSCNEYDPDLSVRPACCFGSIRPCQNERIPD